MLFSADIHRNPDLHHLRFTGMITLNDVRRRFEMAQQQPGFFPGIPTLIDFRSAVGSDMKLQDFMGIRDRLVERHSVADTPMRMAMFVENELLYGIARMFETVCLDSDSLDVRIISGLPEALEFFGLTGSDLAEQLLSAVGPLENTAEAGV